MVLGAVCQEMRTEPKYYQEPGPRPNIYFLLCHTYTLCALTFPSVKQGW